MQWLDVRGQSDAMRFDMDILAAQIARYTNPEELPYFGRKSWKK